MRKFSSTLVLILAMLVCSSQLSAQKPGYSFLRTQIGARPVALAGAFSAIANDLHALHYNPAALAGITKRGALFSYNKYLLDIQRGMAAYLHPLGHGNIAVGVRYHDYGDFERIDASDVAQGNFSANNVVLTAAYARPYTRHLWIAAAAKFFRDQIDTFTSSGFAFDASFYYDSSLLQNLQIGGGIFNAGVASSAYIDTKDDLPMHVELGLSKQLAHLPLRWSLAVKQYIKDDFVVAVGGEFTLSPNLFMRAGYNSLGQDQKTGGDLDRLAGVALGFGLVHQRYKLDYALTSVGEIGTSNQISFALQF